MENEKTDNRNGRAETMTNLLNKWKGKRVSHIKESKETPALSTTNRSNKGYGNLGENRFSTPGRSAMRRNTSAFLSGDAMPTKEFSTPSGINIKKPQLGLTSETKRRLELDPDNPFNRSSSARQLSPSRSQNRKHFVE